jgi:hypothetical protein
MSTILMPLHSFQESSYTDLLHLALARSIHESRKNKVLSYIVVNTVSVWDVFPLIQQKEDILCIYSYFIALSAESMVCSCRKMNEGGLERMEGAVSLA